MSKIFQLDHFGFLRISGVDAVAFMQGYTTCDLAALNEDTAQLGAICNIQGRVLAGFIVVRQGQSLLMRMHRNLVPKVMKFLGKYIVFSKADLTDMSAEFSCYGVLDGDPLRTLRSPFPVVVDDGDEDLTIDLGNRTEHWVRGEMSRAIEPSNLGWIDAEITTGVAWVDDISSEQFLPQMLNYHEQGGISFTKGCYLGQEIVARMQYRGELKKKLHRIQSVPAGRTLESGEIITAGTRSCLAVLANVTGEPIQVTWSDGAGDLALPFTLVQ